MWAGVPPTKSISTESPYSMTIIIASYQDTLIPSLQNEMFAHVRNAVLYWYVQAVVIGFKWENT